jgi:RecB family exonuclease
LSEKPHLSPHQIETYERCGLQWSFRYNEGIKSPPGVKAIKGRATHKSVEANLQSVITHKASLNASQVADIAAEAIEDEWNKQEVWLDPEERKLSNPARIKGAAKDSAVKLAGLHYTKVAPGIDPVAVEERFELELGDSPVNLVGVIDIREPDCIRDTKTRSKSLSDGEAAKSIQLTAYAMKVRAFGLQPFPIRVRLDALVETKAGNVSYDHDIAEKTEHDARRLLRRIDAVWTAIQKGVFLPAPEDSWACSEKFCGYWQMCPYGAKGRVRV